jgi:hypothetical protein
MVINLNRNLTIFKETTNPTNTIWAETYICEL